ncbi:Integrator complex subunit 3 [Glycine soja]
MCKDPLIIVISGPNKVIKNALIICVLFNLVSYHDWISKVKDGGLPSWVNDHTLYFHRRGRGGIAIAASVPRTTLNPILLHEPQQNELLLRFHFWLLPWRRFEASLRQAFESLQPSLRPPFSLSIPTPDQYALLNRAILHGVLTEPHLANTHIKHLHAIVADAHATFLSLLLNAVLQLYPKLLHSVKTQLLRLTEEMLRVLGIGYDAVLLFLLRQIAAADCTDANLSLCSELLTLFLKQFEPLLEGAPHVLSSALYTFLRVLSDKFRVSIEKLEILKRREIHLCVKIVREEFRLCLKIGRDFIRLLQDLAHVPEFKAILQDIVFNPSVTSSWYSLLRISPEMETQLRFLLTDIKLGHHKRQQLWSKQVEESVKLALFYDWLFYDERMDGIMNIKPAVLLMVHSVPKFINVACALLEFLSHLVDRYDVGRKGVIVKGVSSAFRLPVRKGVVRSLDVLNLILVYERV